MGEAVDFRKAFDARQPLSLGDSGHRQHRPQELAGHPQCGQCHADCGGQPRSRTRAAASSPNARPTCPSRQSPIPCGSYQELLQRSDIDAVYLPLPTGIRKEWVLRAADAGKHVLCEKPCGVTSADVRAMLEACRRNQVQFMDGVMFMHSRRLALLRRTSRRSRVGRARFGESPASSVSKARREFMTRNIRVQQRPRTAGLSRATWAGTISVFPCGPRMSSFPSGLRAAFWRSTAGGDSAIPVPTEFSGELFFPRGCECFVLLLVSHREPAMGLSERRPGLRAPAPTSSCLFSAAKWLSRSTRRCFESPSCRFNMEDHTRRLAVHEYSNNAANAQETRMMETFSQIVLSGQLEPSWAEQAPDPARSRCLLAFGPGEWQGRIRAVDP